MSKLGIAISSIETLFNEPQTLLDDAELSELKHLAQHAKTVDDLSRLTFLFDKASGSAIVTGAIELSVRLRDFRNQTWNLYDKHLARLIEERDGQAESEKFLNLSDKMRAMIKFRDQMCDLLRINGATGTKGFIESVTRFSEQIKTVDPIFLIDQLQQASRELLTDLQTLAPETALILKSYLLKQAIAAGMTGSVVDPEITLKYFEDLPAHLRALVVPEAEMDRLSWIKTVIKKRQQVN